MAACVLILTTAQATFATETCKRPKTIVAELQVDWPASPLTSYKLAPDTSLAELVNYFFEWGIGLGGLGVFIALIIAGIQYITSIADPGKLNEAKDRIKSSLIGLVLLLSSWAIFQLINPSLSEMEKKLPDMIKDSAFITEKECTTNGALDCCTMNDPNVDEDTCDLADPSCDPTKTACRRNCPQVPDPNCVVKSWLCCQKNDTKCIEGKSARPLPNSSATNPDPCSSDSQCSEWYCKCDESNWTKHCATNKKFCIMTVNQPDLGCDVIRFYKNGFPDPTTASRLVKCPISTNAENCDYIDKEMPDGRFSGGDTRWNSFTFKDSNNNVVAPKAYEAISWAEDNLGNPLYSDGHGGATTTDSGHGRAPIHCGTTGCSCTIDACYADNPTAESCDTEEGTSGEEWAYNEFSDINVSVYRMRDPTKTTYSKISAGAQSAYSTVTSNVTGFAEDILGAVDRTLGQLWRW